MHLSVRLFLCLIFFFDLELSRSFVSFLLFSLLVCCVCVCSFVPSAPIAASMPVRSFVHFAFPNLLLVIVVFSCLHQLEEKPEGAV